jgi:hypothetical protein
MFVGPRFEQSGVAAVKRLPRPLAGVATLSGKATRAGEAKIPPRQFPKISIKLALVTIWKDFESYQIVNLPGEIRP